MEENFPDSHELEKSNSTKTDGLEGETSRRDLQTDVSVTSPFSRDLIRYHFH